MSSVANEIDGKVFDIQEITPEFNQSSNPDMSQEKTGQEGVAEGNQQGEISDEGIRGTADAFNSVAPEPVMDIYQKDLERYADVPEDSFENSNELSNEQSEQHYDLDDDLSL